MFSLFCECAEIACGVRRLEFDLIVNRVGSAVVGKSELTT